MNLLLKNVNHVEFLTDGVESIWGKCTVFPDLGTRDTDRWLINLYLSMCHLSVSPEPELEKLCNFNKVI